MLYKFYILKGMTNTRSFLFIFVLFASLNPLCSFASRGLYFSVSQMTSSQKNTISDYQQGTVVDIQLVNLEQNNVVNTSAISGKSFDFTKEQNQQANGYLSYDILKSALNNKYITGEVTFKVVTSKSTTATYKLENDTQYLTLNGANFTLTGSSLTTKPTTTGTTMDYTITGAATQKTAVNDEIIAPQYQGNNMCYSSNDGSVACASSDYVVTKLLADPKLTTELIYNDIKGKSTLTTAVINGVQRAVYYHNTLTTPNTISTITNNATIKLAPGYALEIVGTQGTIKNIDAPENTTTTIIGSTTTTTQYACIDSTRYKDGSCEVMKTDFTPSNGLISNSATQTITTNGTTTLTNVTSTSTTNSITGMSTNITPTYTDSVNPGIQLYSPTLAQGLYLSNQEMSILQNIGIDPSKIGANWSYGTLYATINKLNLGENRMNDQDIVNLSKAFSYTQGGTTYEGYEALDRIDNDWKVAQDPKLGSQPYASVIDTNYSTKAMFNQFYIAQNEAEEYYNISSAWTDMFSNVSNILKDPLDSIYGILSDIAKYGANSQRAIEAYTTALNNSLALSKQHNLASYQAEYILNTDGTESNTKSNVYDVTFKPKDWSFEKQELKGNIMNEVLSITPQFSTQSQMQNFVSAFSGQSSSGFEMSVGYKFRMFKSAFYAAPQLDISMFRNISSTTIKGKDQTLNTSDKTQYIYGNIDSSLAGSLVAKVGFENKVDLGIFRTPFSIYGFGGGTSALTKYRSANSQSLGLKYGFGAEIFVSKQLAIFGEMFWINFLKQNINHSETNGYTPSDSVNQYINRSVGTTVNFNNGVAQDLTAKTSPLSIKYADLNQVIDVDSIKYTTNESFTNQGSIQGMKFGLTYYVE